MSAEVEEVEIEEIEEEEREMPSLNHSIICLRIIRQLIENPNLEPLPKLTLDIDKGITPDISVYPKEQISPDFLNDYTKYPKMPILAIEVISASQNIQTLIEKSKILIENNIKTVWTIEPYTNTIFVTTKSGIEKFQNQEIESEGIKVDFKKIFTD